MDGKLESAPEEAFGGLRVEGCGDVRELFADLHELERREAVLLSSKAALVLAVADRIAERQLVEERRGGRGIFSFSTREAALLELAPALGVSPKSAKVTLVFAETLREYPKLAEKLAAGEVTAKTAQFVVHELANAPKPWREELDTWLAEKAPRWRLCSGVKIQNLMQAQYVKFDADWVAEKRERAKDQRGIFFRPSGDGMAKLWGTMPLLEAARVKDSLDAIARTVCEKDPRAPWARRSDALVAITDSLGTENEPTLVCECGRDACKAAQRPAPQAKPVSLVVDLAVLAHLSDLPAWLDGAAIDPELARALAKAAKNIRFTTRPEDYVPTAAVKTHVEARDQHCRFPGCHRRARTEIDHSDPFNHRDPKSGGRTVPENLKRLCKYHHRAKTHGKWRDIQLPDGTVIWISPTGQRYTTKPGDT